MAVRWLGLMTLERMLNALTFAVENRFNENRSRGGDLKDDRLKSRTNQGVWTM